MHPRSLLLPKTSRREEAKKRKTLVETGSNDTRHAMNSIACRVKTLNVLIYSDSRSCRENTSHVPYISLLAILSLFLIHSMSYFSIASLFLVHSTSGFSISSPVSSLILSCTLNFLVSQSVWDQIPRACLLDLRRQKSSWLLTIQEG